MGKKLIIKNANFYDSAIEHPGDGVHIDVVAKPVAGGVCTGAGIYSVNRSVEITATPNTGYKFGKWNDGDTNSTRTVVATEDKIYTACFAEKIFDHTYSSKYESVNIDTMPAGDYIVVADNVTGTVKTQVIFMMDGTEIYRTPEILQGGSLETIVTLSNSFDIVRSAVCHVSLYKIAEP